MGDELQQGIPAESAKAIRVSYRNKQEDLLAAMEAVDQKNREGTRRTLHLMAVVLVGYWAVDILMQEPGFFMGWVMLALAIGLGIFVWREPKAGNLRYTSQYVEKAPEGAATVDTNGVSIEDGTGSASFLYANGAKVYKYKNILALDGGKRRFGMIPLDQLEETDREALLSMVQKAGCFETLEAKQTGAGGLFRKK